jgi:hypothetical protein
MMSHPTSARQFVSLVIISFALTGCFGGPEADHHESVEHFVPDHWPADLLDAAAKVAQRASALAGQSTESPTDGSGSDRRPMIERELRDVVGWVPEIAADTPLTEAQWMVVHEASEAMSNRLKTIRRPMDEETLRAIDEYRRLLVETSETLLGASR